MGGIGSHGHSSYLAQTVAFAISLLLPGAALALVAGAYWEQFRRRIAIRPVPKQVTGPLPLAAEWSAE